MTVCTAVRLYYDSLRVTSCVVQGKKRRRRRRRRQDYTYGEHGSVCFRGIDRTCCYRHYTRHPQHHNDVNQANQRTAGPPAQAVFNMTHRKSLNVPALSPSPTTLSDSYYCAVGAGALQPKIHGPVLRRAVASTSAPTTGNLSHDERCRQGKESLTSVPRRSAGRSTQLGQSRPNDTRKKNKETPHACTHTRAYILYIYEDHGHAHRARGGTNGSYSSSNDSL